MELFINKISALQPIHKEFSEALTFCWNLRKGFNDSIDKYRLKLYTDWYYKNCLAHHFIFEEKYIYTQFSNNKNEIHKAKSYQRKLKKLFNDHKNIENSISLIEEELEAYIRFEKHKIYNIIIETIPRAQLNTIMKSYKENTVFENWNDPFWKTNKN